MNTNQPTTPARQAAINGLAIVGFIALVTAGIWLAVYSTRFVPTVVNNIGAAAVYLGSVFNPASDSSISVVPTASTTISFGTSTTTSTTTTVTTTPAPVATTPGAKSVGTYQIGGTAAAAPYGLPDLAVTVTAVGYLTTASADSFVANASVPSGERPAVRFVIKNIGTNWTGTWRFNASIPTRTTYVYKSPVQQSLASGDSIEYTLGFDRADKGTDQTISITANSDSAVTESSTTNNTVSVKITIL